LTPVKALMQVSQGNRFLCSCCKSRTQLKILEKNHIQINCSWSRQITA